MRIAALFFGASGLYLGFEKVSFEVVWANEFDKTIWEVFEKNDPAVILDRKSTRFIQRYFNCRYSQSSDKVPVFLQYTFWLVL